MQSTNPKDQCQQQILAMSAIDGPIPTANLRQTDPITRPQRTIPATDPNGRRRRPIPSTDPSDRSQRPIQAADTKDRCLRWIPATDPIAQSRRPIPWSDAFARSQTQPDHRSQTDRSGPDFSGKIPTSHLGDRSQRTIPATDPRQTDPKHADLSEIS